MSETPKPQYNLDDEIDLRELFVNLWTRKWLIIATTLVFAACAVAYALYKPNIYQASVLLAPVQNEGGSIGALSSQLGGLASLAGINLGGGDSNQTVIAKEVLQSRAFLAEFMHRHELLKPIMAVEGWNRDTNEWIYDRSVYNPEANEWLPDSDGKSQKPTDWELVEAFREDHLSVSEAKDTGMITVSIEHYSPIAAQQWAQWLIDDINEKMRMQDVKKAENRIAYLNEKLTETNVAGVQQVFYELIENETRTVMLANAQEEYVFRIVDPAVIPEEHSEPRRLIILVIMIGLGIITGISLSLFLSIVRKNEATSDQA